MVPDDERSDAGLLVEISSDDQRTMTALYHRHSPWLMARLSHRCGDTEVVDLAIRDTFECRRAGTTTQGHGRQPTDQVGSENIRRLAAQFNAGLDVVAASGDDLLDNCGDDILGDDEEER